MSAELPGSTWRVGEALGDSPESWPVTSTERGYDGSFVSLRVDTVDGPDGASFERAVVEHPGAVGVLAMDDEGRVLLLSQYRHAVGRRLLELPAGIRDVSGEDPVLAAARELAEEASVQASDWRVLLEIYSSPGVLDEHWLIYLARGLEVAEDSDYVRVHEEADMSAVWVPLDEAVRAVLDRRLCDSMAAAALLAAHALAGGGVGGGVSGNGLDALDEVTLG